VVRTLLAIVASLLVCLGTLGGGAGSAAAFEAWDGRIQVHGFYEKQLRTLTNDFDFSDDIDVAQWWNVLNIEMEAELLPFGAGPITYMAGFARVEVRFDCVWSNLCSIGNGAPAWGDRAKHLPKRLSSGRKDGFSGALPDGDTRRLHAIPIEDVAFRNRDKPVGDSRQPISPWNVPGIDTLFGQPGFDGEVGTEDDPAFFVFESILDFRFASRSIKGSRNGRGNQILGPWLPSNRIDPLGTLADRPNPFNPLDFNPIAGATGAVGTGELPFRPAPNFAASEKAPMGNSETARGLFLPNSAVADLMRRGKFDSFDQNFRESELQFNRGASQQDEKELKELYLDIEALDGKLWLRIGKQNIVWGKTELFRTTDQFNPQDIALASLPTLEESRIPLWAARAVWSFGRLGPAQDVRLEVAANLDDHEATDLGACGEAFTPNPVCNISFGLFGHGLAGIGLAGRRNPPDWWNDGHGLEYGARLEWRMGIFSFALIDFYGFADTPHVQRVFAFERNVDPRTGRMRRNNSRLGCDPDGLFDGDIRGCLTGGDDALRNSPTNQQFFALLCASTVGFTELDRSSCAQSVLNSQRIVAENPFVGPDVAPTDAFGMAFGGDPRANLILSALAGLDPAAGELLLGPAGQPILVTLNQDPMDGAPPSVTITCTDGFFNGACLSTRLTDQQEALLGCGPFFGTNCDVDGIDLLNAEASALFQAFPGEPGTFNLEGWDTFDASRIQPGTLGFEGGAICTRYEGGQTFTLPGCLGPGDPDWDPNIDGNIAGLLHPFTGQQFKTEMGAVSWNLLMTLVALSGLGLGPDEARAVDQFDPGQPFRNDGCSLRRTNLCSNVRALFSVANTTRSTARAGGNSRFGRVDFSWHSGGTGVLRFEKRNVLGFSTDFVHDPSKTSWSIEATWINDVPMTDNDEFDGLTEVDTYNLTISMDRPTFVNFLNNNRTFFINTQWFFQQVVGFRDSFESNGPFNVLMTFTINTGYFQDRLLPQITFVYDFGSNSGAVLQETTYRFSQDFSASLGLNIFAGRFEKRPRSIAPLGTPGFNTGKHKDSTFVENGLAAVRDRDEIFMRIRYTF